MESKTILVATLGHASAKREIIEELIKHKVDIFRLNFSWETHEWHGNLIKNIRELSAENGLNISIMQDLSGPRIQEENGHHFDKDQCGGIITEKDISDLTFGIEEGVDYTAMSFVGCASDVIELRNLIKERGGNQKIISKIERKIAVENLKEIIDVSDGIMVARGDLGNEFPLEEIPFVQHKIISECNKAGKMVIVATEMLLSMVEKDTPTRAEVSDVAYAIIDGADGIMVSDESAKGKHPIDVVIYMEKIALEAEKNRNSILIG